MITNDRQLANTRTQAARFRASLEALEGGSMDATDLHPLLKTAQVDAVRSQLEDLEREIQDYEALRSGRVSRFDLTSLGALPDTLIKARIAAGLSQRDLADRLSLKEQQIQRYEAARYDGASFRRLVDVADAIGLTIHNQVELLNRSGPKAIVANLKAIGLDDRFIRRRLAPDLALDEDDASDLAERVGHVFGWAPSAILAGASLDVMALGGASARFKMPKGRDGQSVTLYAAYAYRLAEICAAAMQDRPRFDVPTDWSAFRQAVIDRYDALDFRTVLSFAWDLGIVVLPLNDPGAFHGACWRRGGVNVIVLKQALRYPARWLFDLLHELRHAGEAPGATEFEVVEGAETSDDRRNAPEERQASWFSGQVALDGRAEDLVKICMTRSGGDLRRMKSAVEAVADEEGFSPGQLANYMAFRLSLQGENWWGPAANLQDAAFDPLVHARDVFFERFAFDRLDDPDLSLLTLALHDETVDD